MDTWSEPEYQCRTAMLPQGRELASSQGLLSIFAGIRGWKGS